LYFRALNDLYIEDFSITVKDRIVVDKATRYSEKMLA